MAFNKKTIRAVKVLGVRSAEETKVLATYNTTIYSVLVEYSDGSRAIDECDAKHMSVYLPYIEM